MSKSDTMAIWSVLNPEPEERPPPSRAQSDSGTDICSTSTRTRDYTQSPDSTYSFSSNIPIRTMRSHKRRHSYESRTEPYRSAQKNGRRREQERREFRPTYREEEEYFIWYHRIDLGMDWPQVIDLFNATFIARRRQGLQGIQCKYYRCLTNHQVPPVRERNKTVDSRQKYSLRRWMPTLYYSWMR